MHNLPVLTANEFFSVRNILRKSFYEVGRASGPCLHLVSDIKSGKLLASREIAHQYLQTYASI